MILLLVAGLLVVSAILREKFRSPLKALPAVVLTMLAMGLSQVLAFYLISSTLKAGSGKALELVYLREDGIHPLVFAAWVGIIFARGLHGPRGESATPAALVVADRPREEIGG